MSTPSLSESCACGARIISISPHPDEPAQTIDQFRRRHQACRPYDAAYDGRAGRRQDQTQEDGDA